MRSKLSVLRSPLLSYMHRLLAQSINATRDSPGVVGEHDLFYLYSMRERYPIHLGYAVANFIMGQAQRRKTAALYAGHFITHLVRGMGLWSELPPMELMCRMAPLGISTLTAMHMIQRDRRAGMQGYVLVGGQDHDIEREPRDPQPPVPPQPPAPSPAVQCPPYTPTEASSSQTQLDRIEGILGQLLSSHQELLASQRTLATRQLTLETSLMDIRRHLAMDAPFPASASRSPSGSSMHMAQTDAERFHGDTDAPQLRQGSATP